MRITVLGIGSTGDIQPPLILAEALQKQGHTVRLAVPISFEQRVREKNIPYSPIRIDVQTIFQGEFGQRYFQSGRNPIERIRIILEEGYKLIEPLDEDVWVACQDAEVIVTSDLLGYIAQSAAEALDIPILELSVMPVYPSHELKHALFPVNLSLGRWFNRLTGQLMERVFWLMLRTQTNQLRQTLKLPPHTMQTYLAAHRQVVFMQCYSTHVLPRATDYPSQVHVTGYWFENTPDFTPPAELQAFLAAGDKPLYIGFGSGTHADPTGRAHLIIEAVKRSGQRAIVAEGWGGIQMHEIPPEFHVVKGYVPHHWLFQQVKAIIHHGGAGTTAAALRSGVPSAIVPYMGDQFFWSDRLYKMGIIPKPIPQKELTADNLTATIQQLVSDAHLQQKSAEIGAKIQAEDGIGYAIRLIEETVQQHKVDQ